MSLFECKEAKVGYHKKPIHKKSLTFSVPRDHIVVLLGKNGSGKTTLLRALLGEKFCLEGEILLDSKTSKNLSLSKLSKEVAYLPQDQVFPYYLKVVDYLRLAFLNRSGLFGKIPEERIQKMERLAEKFFLKKYFNRHLQTLSTGERQKVFLLRTILQDSKILILDEPTNHLDPGVVSEFWNLLQSLADEKKMSVLLSTHDLAFAKTCSQWIVGLNMDGLLFNGRPETFFGSRAEEELYSTFE